MTEPTATPLSILWLNQLDPGHPWAGGAERHIEEVGRRLVERGHSVTVVAERFGALPESDWRSGVRILRPVRRGFLHAWVLSNARRLVDEYGIDVVVGDLSKILPWGQHTLGGRPLVSVVRHFNGRAIFSEASFPAPPVLWGIERFTPLFLRTSEVITESRTTAGIAERLGLRGDRISLAPPGVDVGRYHPAPEERSRTPLVVYVGRLKRYKRLELALRAFARLAPAYPTAEFHIAGSGSDHDRLVALSRSLGLESRVRFLGVLPSEEIVRLYQRAWVHVQPSSAEGWGLTALEAMACGTPVVAFAGGALPETVGPLCADLLAEQPTAASLARALERGFARSEVTDPEAARRLVTYARGFSWDATATRYAALLGSAARGFTPRTPTLVPAPFRRPRPGLAPAGARPEVAERAAADRAGTG